MQVKHLDHVNLSVADFEATVDWYGRVFGFELVEDEVASDGTRWGVIRGGDAMLCIYEHPDWEYRSPQWRHGAKVHGFAHFGLRILDADEWEATATREGVAINYGGEVVWPSSRSWYVVDPTGYEIEVVCWNDDTVRFAELTAGR